MAKVNKKKKKKVAAKKAKPKSKKRGATSRERRKFKRIAARGLLVTEFAGDYRYVITARDISEGGIFLNGRLKTTNEGSVIQLSIDGRSIQIDAVPVRDQITHKNCGTGYKFINVSAEQSKAIRSVISAARTVRS